MSEQSCFSCRGILKTADVQLQGWLRRNHPDLNLTVIPASNCPLLPFAYAGNATATLEKSKDEPVIRWRGYVQPARRGGQGALGDATFFAKYHYAWGGEDFILHTVGSASQCVQYILKEPDTSNGEDAFSHCSNVDKLIMAAVDFSEGDSNKFIYVYDRYWTRSRSLWESVQKAEWENVILDPKQKKALKSVSKAFFDSKDTYERYGVPWKRGLIFYGPPGNGKTISIKAMMHELSAREQPVPTLYVKSAPQTYDIRAVFTLARQFSPCLLVMEDIETIVTSNTRSYFFNEVDGLENNDGIMMVASTNYIDRLDPGLSRRPSRFDRKYLFPLPDMDQRVLYAEYWRGKLAKTNPKVDFPEKLCRPIAAFTDKFSFAYMQEAFVAALLELARHDVGLALCEIESGQDGDDFYTDAYVTSWDQEINAGRGDDLDRYKLWVAIRKSVALLRKDLDEGEEESAARGEQKDLDADQGMEPGPESWEDSNGSRRPRTLPFRQDTLGPRLDSQLSTQVDRQKQNGRLVPRTIDGSHGISSWTPHQAAIEKPETDNLLFPSPFLSGRSGRFSGEPREKQVIGRPLQNTGSTKDWTVPENRNPRQATEEELYAAGVAKYPFISQTAYEQEKCPW